VSASGPLDGERALAQACARGEPDALATLEKLYWPRVRVVIERVDARPAFVDDVLQQLRQKLLVADAARAPRIAEFAGTGPLVSWLRAAAVRTALNARRPHAREDAAEEDALEALPLSQPTPELAVMLQRHRPVFKAAFRAALATLEAKERTLLKLQVVDGLSLERIGVIYAVNKSTVSRWLARAQEQLMGETRARLEAELGVSGGELESLVRAMRSGLELSVAALVEEG
jgi:RNA polymerase sigma-70 factor, ECF subfamily